MKSILLITLLFLSSCAGIEAQKARTSMIGETLPDLIACAGKPSSTIAVNHDDVVLQYDQTTPVQPQFNVGGIDGVSLGLGSMGECHMIIRVHSGYVGSIHYTGQSWTFGGILSACAPLINSCYDRSDKTIIPSNYNQFEILGVKQPE